MYRTIARSIVILATTGGLNSFANTKANELPLNTTESRLEIRMNGIYKFAQDSQLTPTSVFLNGEYYDNQTGGTLTFEKDEPVAVEFDTQGNALLIPILSEEEKGVIPEQVFISKEEFMRVGFQFSDEGDVNTLNQKYSAYVNTDLASRHGGRARRRGHHRGIGNCVAFVKARVGIFGHWGDGKGATRALMGHGYHSVGCSSPRVGTVASWTGGWHGKGHTGWWNGRCFQYDRGCGSPGSKYRLVGCVAR